MKTASALADANIVIVGAGAVGSCVAYRLAQAGASVTIIDRNYPGGGTTGNSFAWLNAFNKFPRDYYRLNIESIRAHRDLQWELNGNWLTLNGGLHWQSASGQSPYGDLDETLKRLRGWGARIDAYSPEEVRNIEPALRIDDDQVEAVYLVRDEGWIQPALLIQALLHRAVSEYDVKFVSGSVTAMTGGNGEVTGVVLESGEKIASDVVLLAGGPDSAQLASLAGANLPVETNHGILAVTAPVPAMIQRVIIAPDVILRPDGGGRIMATSESLSSVSGDIEPSADLPEMKDLLTRLEHLVPSLRGATFESYRKGVRALPQDGYPIVGFDPNIHGLYYAVMHSGITLSAGIAEFIVEDFVDPDADRLARYRPERFDSGRTAQGPAGE